MDKDMAREFLRNLQGIDPFEIGEAVDVLRPDYASFSDMAQDFQNITENTLRRLHLIFQLPKGIGWMIDRGEISIKMAEQIARLKNYHDQCFLALAIVKEKLVLEACINTVNRVLNHGDSIRDALTASDGGQCDRFTWSLQSFGSDYRFSTALQAWELNKTIQDYVYDQICRYPNEAPRRFVHDGLLLECNSLLTKLNVTLSQLLKCHR